MGLAWYGRAIGVWISHRGPDVPPWPGCSIAIQPCCHYPALPCHHGPTVSLGSRCLIGVQMFCWGQDAPPWSRCSITTQPFCHHLALPCCHGPAMPLRSRCVIQGPGVPLRSGCHAQSCFHDPVPLFHHSLALPLGSGSGPGCPAMVRVSQHNPDTLPRSGPAVLLWSGHTSGVWMPQWNLDVLSWSRRLFVIHPWCHHPPLLCSCALAMLS